MSGWTFSSSPRGAKEDANAGRMPGPGYYFGKDSSTTATHRASSYTIPMAGG